MRDLLNDLTETTPPSNDPMLAQLNDLEKELEGGSTKDSGEGAGAAMKAPGLAPPGLAPPSVGAMVVGHAARAQPPSAVTSTSVTPVKTQDAWSAALSQLNASSLAEDFLKADSARKEKKGAAAGAPPPGLRLPETSTDDAFAQGEKMSSDLVDRLFEEEGDYDVKDAAVLDVGENDKTMMANLLKGDTSFVTNPKEDTRNNTATAQPKPSLSPARQILPQSQPSFSYGPPSSSTPIPSPGGMPPPHVLAMMQQQQQHPGRMMPPPPPGAIPPHMMGGPPPHGIPGAMVGGQNLMSGPPPKPHMLHPPMNVPGTFPPHLPPGVMPPHPAMMMMMQRQSQQQPAPKPSVPPKEEQIFQTQDFPALGTDEATLKQEQEANKIASTKRKPKNTPRVKSPQRRISFSNPSPQAEPIIATAIPSTSMTPRDLCHVLHSMMRPLLSFTSVLDAYNADYYRWSFDDRKSRNLLLLGGGLPQDTTDLPNPVWNETKVKAREMEENFRVTVEKRAEDWSKEKHILGKVVKVNVKRPRALLATTTLSSSGENRVSDEGIESEEDRQRAILWASRLAIDKGYLAYLNLVELRRLLQSEEGEVESRREELLCDLEENVGKLHNAFGVRKDSSDIIQIDEKSLSRTLSLPKGRMLLSRVIDEGVLPHQSACYVLPSAMKILFDSFPNAESSAAPPAGEDRLLRSLTGLVRTVKPSVDGENLLSCLSCAINMKTILDDKKRSMKGLLTGKRTLMELLHAVLSRGAEVCAGGVIEKKWKEKEGDFLIILSET